MTLTLSRQKDSAWRLSRHRGEIGWGVVLRLGRWRLALWSVDMATRVADLLFQREALATFLKNLGFTVHLIETNDEKIINICEAPAPPSNTGTVH